MIWLVIDANGFFSPLNDFKIIAIRYLIFHIPVYKALLYFNWSPIVSVIAEPFWKQLHPQVCSY